MNNEFRKEPDAGKPHVRNSVRDTSGNGRIYSTIYFYDQEKRFHLLSGMHGDYG